MKNTIFKTTVYLFILSVYGCSSPASLCLSRWQEKPVTVDGKLTEWQIPLDLYDKDTKLNYVISNDDTNLYYWIRVTDDKEQIRVLRAGMQFWIDTTGKNDLQVGVQFPFSQYSDMFYSQNAKGEKSRTSQDSALLRRDEKKWTGKLDQMHLIGFHYPIAGTIPVVNTYGIKVAIAHDSSGVTLYEARIPFKTFYKPYLTAADNNKQLGITIIINPMPSVPHSAANHGGNHGAGGGGFGGPGGMGGGGFAGGGMHGGRRGGSGSEDNSDEDQYNLQSGKLKLALRLSAR